MCRACKRLESIRPRSLTHSSRTHAHLVSLAKTLRSAFPPSHEVNGGPGMALGRDVHPPDELQRTLFPVRANRRAPRRATMAGKVDGTMHRTTIRAAIHVTGAAISILWVTMLWAGTTGKLTGKVTNEKNEALSGVNVRVKGQRLGALTDDKGEFVIIGVPGGTYLVRANLMGFAPYVVQNVAIQPDFTTTLNIALKTEAIQQQEVRVE